MRPDLHHRLSIAVQKTVYCCVELFGCLADFFFFC
jgi:hypothetical protein